MALKHRLQKLEARREPLPCPECGNKPHSPGSHPEILVDWIDDEDDPRMDEEPTICATCGEPDFIVVKWLDLEDTFLQD